MQQVEIGTNAQSKAGSAVGRKEDGKEKENWNEKYLINISEHGQWFQESQRWWAKREKKDWSNQMNEDGDVRKKMYTKVVTDQSTLTNHQYVYIEGRTK